MRTGVILARLQPIHNGHVELIKRAAAENDEVYIFVGSADKFNKRNPIPISTRIELAKKAILETMFPDEVEKHKTDAEIDSFLWYSNIRVVPLDDLDDESNNTHEWGFYLYSKVVTTTGNPNFTMYYSDGFEIITTWFPGFILRNNVSLSLLARNSIENGISATTVRKHIVEGNDKELSKAVPKIVFERRDNLRMLIKLSENVD